MWTVDLTSDTGAQDPNNKFAGDLRYCLANAQNGDTIDFNIPGNGFQTIALTGTLNVTKSVTIDATSQPGYNGQPLIAIDGSANNVQGDALDVTAPNVVIKGLDITNFTSGAAVDLNNANGGCTVQACYFGVSPTGNTGPFPNQYGVKIFNSAGNTITGDVISGNYTGVWIQGAGSTQNSVTNCDIGTDFTGKVAIPNGNPNNPTGSGVGDGVYIVTSASNNYIGGDYYTQQNVISGNLKNGVEIDFQSNGNYVQGNIIGLSVTGAPLVNGNGANTSNIGDGVHVFDASNNNVIGGNSGFDDNGNWVDYGNVISGNGKNGISIDHTQPYAGPSGTQILGNYIGLGTDGATPQPNGRNGVLIWDSPNTVIGDGAVGDGNVISGNGKNGIFVDSTTMTSIFGNYIGTDVTGMLLNKGNQNDGILINASQTQVGQAGASSLNVISGNDNYGVEVNGGTTNTIANNYIGVGSNGAKPVGNGEGGVAVDGTASYTTIGGANYDLGNVISGNRGTPASGGSGVDLLSGSSYTTVAGNLIGTDASGLNPVPNAVDGIYIQINSTYNTIGLIWAFNLICYNDNYGIEVYGTNNTIDCNYVGINAAGLVMANGTGPNFPPGQASWWVDNSGGNTNSWGALNFNND
jgi:hypothetical protein